MYSHFGPCEGNSYFHQSIDQLETAVWLFGNCTVVVVGEQNNNFILQQSKVYLKQKRETKFNS